MTAVLLAGTAPASVLEAVRPRLEAHGARVTGPRDTDGSLRAIVTGEAAFAAAIVLVSDRLGEAPRRDAYVLWQLGVPVWFAIAGQDTTALAAECEGFAAGLGQAGAPWVPLAPGPMVELVAQLPAPVPARAVAPTIGASDTPPADQIRATVAWSAPEPLLRGRSYVLGSGRRELTATVAPIKHRLDLATLEPTPATHLAAGEVGDCDLELDGPIATEAFRAGGGPGAFVLGDRLTGEPVGIGIVRFGLRRAANLRWQAVTVDAAARAAALGQTPCVLWLTGLSGAGKSTIADRVESALHARGHHTYLLDGDNVRHGLNRDLGFTDADRVENIRRVAEVAQLMTDAGLIVLVSFISPFASERAMARELFAPGAYHEIHVDAPLAVAEARDPKGLYAKARAGQLCNFTGIDSPYEPPEDPELRIDTTALDPDEAAAAVIALLERQGVLRAPV